MLCFAAKWAGDNDVLWFHENDDSMIESAWHLLDAADVVCTYNGRRFDIPILNKEFILAGMGPPSPYQQLDLIQVMRQKFRFPSNKLEYVCDVLEVTPKRKTSGHGLWVRCMLGNDPAAWTEMEEYNKGDVISLEDVYYEIRPWISNHPSIGLYEDEAVTGCPRCPVGSGALKKRGFTYASSGKYQRYRCSNCGGWSQDTKRIDAVEIRST